MKKFFKILSYTAGLVITFGVGFIAGGTAPETSSSLPPTPLIAEATAKAQPVNAKPVPTRKAGIYDEGILLVPGEVPVGRYRAVVPDDSYGCYWARLKDLDNGLDSIKDNGNHDPGEKVTVVIQKTDKAFETSGCGNWVKF